MQYMIVAATKETLSPSEYSKMLKKFQSWQPPDGLTVDGIWANGTGGYILVNTDDYTLVCEMIAQFSTVNNFSVDPVVPAQEIVSTMVRGLDWAMS